jgi:hypothetical protein
MQGAAKKQVILIIEEGIRPDVLEIMKSQGIEHYTLWTGIEGVGETGPKRGNPIWPGLNDVFLLVLDGEQVEPLVDALHRLRDSLPIVPGMKFVISDAIFI